MKKMIKYLMRVGVLALAFSSCQTPDSLQRTVDKTVPDVYQDSGDTTNTANVIRTDFFTDPYLQALIDTALQHNQELQITLMEIQIGSFEVNARKGEYLPSVGLGAGAGLDKTARYTPLGANEATTDIRPGTEMPDPVPDYFVGAFASWEVDIWHKLRNAKKAAFSRYLSSVEGQNFMVTNLVAEIANTYYELLALDSQLEIVRRNIAIQSNALSTVRLQKQSARATELAVRRFEAQVLKTKSMEFELKQRIIETENQINFLLGRFPQRVARNPSPFLDLDLFDLQAGIPIQLLENRPDIRGAELRMEATHLDVKSAKAQFYPTLDITAAIGLNAFQPDLFLKTPESMLFSLAGNLAAPLINRKAIEAAFQSSNARQVQAVYAYEQTLLTAYIEVANQLSNLENLDQSYDLLSDQVDALTESIDISNDLFRSARADYMEVLLTQRDALESTFDLIETKKRQLNARINMYRSLGGGWK
ncbi:MAG: multidrug efflux system outer membrane protein [Cryomorphaceae bacterium]|jgi:multidrug efflux system outer membrane protein